VAAKYGDSSANQPESRNVSANSGYDITRVEATAALGIGSSSLSDVIQMHLVDCEQCRKAVLSGPVGIGQRSKHCADYWQLQLMQAQYEGRVNNVVAYTEHGDEAPKGGELE
jgi:hypothetical protein